MTTNLLEKILNDFREHRARVVSVETGAEILEQAEQLGLQHQDLYWLWPKSQEEDNEAGDEEVCIL